MWCTVSCAVAKSYALLSRFRSVPHNNCACCRASQLLVLSTVLRAFSAYCPYGDLLLLFAALLLPTLVLWHVSHVSCDSLSSCSRLWRPYLPHCVTHLLSAATVAASTRKCRQYGKLLLLLLIASTLFCTVAPLLVLNSLFAVRYNSRMPHSNGSFTFVRSGAPKSLTEPYVNHLFYKQSGTPYRLPGFRNIVASSAPLQIVFVLWPCRVSFLVFGFGSCHLPPTCRSRSHCYSAAKAFASALNFVGIAFLSHSAGLFVRSFRVLCFVCRLKGITSAYGRQ